MYKVHIKHKESGFNYIYIPKMLRDATIYVVYLFKKPRDSWAQISGEWIYLEDKKVNGNNEELTEN